MSGEGPSVNWSLPLLWRFSQSPGRERRQQARFRALPSRLASFPLKPSLWANRHRSLDLTSYFADPDGDALAYAAIVSDVATATVSVSGDILTIVGLAPGTAVLNVFASDPGGLSATQRTRITVAAPNRAPEAVGTIPAQTLTPGQWVSFSVSSYFRDPDGEALSFSATTSDTAVASVTVVGDIVTVRMEGPGAAIVNVMARDSGGISARQGITVATGSAPTPAPSRAVPSEPVQPEPVQPEPVQPEAVQPEPAPLQRTQPAAPETMITVALGVSRGDLSMSGPGGSPNTSAVFGPAFDAYAAVPFGGGLGAQLGLGYVSRGSHFRGTDGAVAIDADVSFGDMIVTALARFEPISMFYIAAGPHMSLNWDCSMSVTVVGPGFRQSQSGDCEGNDIELEYDKFDYGLTGTVGVELDLGPFRGVANAVYHHGLGNISENPDTARHRAMVFHVGVVLPKG